MKVQKSAISRVLAVVVVIVIVVVAVGAYYLISAPSSSGTSTSSPTSHTSSSTSQISTVSTTPTTSTSSTTSTSTSVAPTSSSTSASTSSTSTTPSSSSATTSSTSSTTSQTSTSSATASSTSCSSTSTSAGQGLVAYYSAYSSMSFSFQGTKNGASENLSVTYNVVYHSSTTFKVNLNTVLNGQTTPLTVWITNDGTVVALLVFGSNHTGSVAANTFLGYFSDLQTLETLTLQESANTAYFHSAGTSTAKIGSNSFIVTDYVANTSPETVQACNGDSAVLSTANFYAGTPSGSSLELLTNAQFDGSFTTASGTNALDYTYQITALTVA